MSLINKVLSDLDKRGAADTGSSDVAGLDTVRFSQVPKRKTNSYTVISIFLISITLFLATGFFFFETMFAKIVEYKQIASTQIPLKPNSSDKTTDLNMLDSKKKKAPVKNKTVLIQKKKPLTQERKSNMSKPALKSDVATSQNAMGKVRATKVSLSIAKNKISMSKQEHPPVSAKKQSAKNEMVEAKVNVTLTKSNIPLRQEQRAEVAYQSAYLQLKSKHNRRAERTLRKALALEPSHIKARELLSGVYIKQGRWIEASELLRNGVSLSPKHITFSKLYARALMQLNQDVLAISVLQRHAPKMSHDPNYFAILAALYQRQNNHALAVTTYSKIVKIQPQNGVWWVGLGISLEALGKTRQAHHVYRQARKSGSLQNDVKRFTHNRIVALDEIDYPGRLVP